MTVLRMLGKFRIEAGILSAYTLLAILFTYPLILHLNSHVVGFTGDSEEYMWAFWWMRQALLEDQTNPFYTYRLYYPQGVSLRFFAFNPLHSFLSIPLQLAFGLKVAYNLMAILTFIAIAYTTYWLGRTLTGSRVAGFVAGIVFAFAPTQVFHFTVGQPNLYAVQFIPLFVLCLWRWLDGGRVAWLIGAAIALVLSSFADWQFAVYLQLFIAAVLLARFWERRHAWRGALWDLGRRVVALQAIYTVAVLPLLVPMVQEMRSPDAYMFRGRDDTAGHAADLLSFFVPNPEHPLWRTWATDLRVSLLEPGMLVTTTSLSYVALALAVYGAVRRWQQARFWVFCGLGFAVLALGPHLRVLGQDTGILMPYELLFQIPVIQISRVPARYAIISMVCLAVLVAFGIQALLSRSSDESVAHPSGGSAGSNAATWRRAVAVSALTALLCFELLPAPVRLEAPPPTPAFFTDGTLDEAGALLEIPNPDQRTMYYSTLHQRPVLYGSLSRDNPVGPEVAYLRYGLLEEEPAEIFDHVQNWMCTADYYRITHLVLYHDGRPESYLAQQYVNARLAPETQIQQTPEATLYQLPRVPRERTCVQLGSGWDTVRPGGQGLAFERWTGQEATLGLLRHAPGPVTLRFKAHSFAFARQLQILHADQVLAQFEIGELDQHTLDLDLPVGRTWLTLRTVEPAVSPADYGYQETTPVAISYADLVVEQR